MDLYKRQQFEFLLQTAVERLSERLEQRYRGTEDALHHLQSKDAQPIVNAFVDAIFQDFLLDNIEGACFLLQSVPQRKLVMPLPDPSQTVQSALIAMAKQQFQTLLYSKAIEALEQRIGYQPVPTGADLS